MNRGVDLVSLSQTTYARNLRRDREHIDRFVDYEVQPSRMDFLRQRKHRTLGDRVEQYSVHIIVTGCAFLALVGLSNLLHH